MSREDELRAALEKAKKALEEQDAYIKQISAEATKVAFVITPLADRDGHKVALVAGGGMSPTEMVIPTDLARKVKPGQQLMVTKAGEIGRLGDWQLPGDIVTVTRYAGAGMAEIELPSGTRVVYCDDKAPPKAGDRVALDPTNSCVMRNLGRPPVTHTLQTAVNVQWADIGGNDEAKDTLRDAIENAVKHADVMRRFGRKPPRGVLLYGPPGNGKTMLGKAAATAAAKMSGGAAEGAFMYIKGPELLSKFVGESERMIRAIFTQARGHWRETGQRVIVFIDEADAILNRRGSRRSSDVDMTIVPQFLAEMDGLEDSGIYFILATNRPDALDPAVVREGRIDRKIKVDRPDPAVVSDIIKINLRDKPLAVRPGDLAKVGVDEIFQPARLVKSIAIPGRPPIALTMGHLVSGAMVATIVDTAAENAMRRAIAKPRSDVGLDLPDIVGAVDTIYRGLRDLDHTDALIAVAEDMATAAAAS